MVANVTGADPVKVRAHRRRWFALVLLCAAFSMVILDSTIVYVALPSIQHALGFSAAGVQWVITVYLLTFAGLLLLGGRTADLVGRRTVFMVGVALFTLASLGCALAPSAGVLLAAWAGQGVAAAMLTPAALALLITTSVVVDTHEEGEPMSLHDNPMPSSVPAVDQTLVLADGRTLGYALWGEPGGSPVLLLGTSPGSRLLCPDLPATLAAGVRLVTVDRPGSGRSDPDPHPGMARWVADTTALVDHLRLGRVGLVGWSGGGQFALAAAAGLPERVTAVALAGTPAPAHDDLGDWPPEEIRQLVGLVRTDPHGATEAVAAANQWYPADPQSPMRLWSAPGDQAVAGLPQVAGAMAVMLREGARQGAAGLAYDIVAGSLDWGFPLAEVRSPVALWYGTVDPVVSPQHGRYYAQRLPQASRVHTRAADHLLAIPLWADILGSLGLPQGR